MKNISAPWLILTFLYMMVIWTLSSRSSLGQISAVEIEHLDKLVHLVEYSILAFLWVMALKHKHFFLICIMVALFGGIDELHQQQVYNRAAEFYDYVMDALAGIIVCSGMAYRSHKKSLKTNSL